jgi:hypothetical protein
MHKNFHSKQFTMAWGSYEASSIHDANVLIIWGLTSPKLTGLIKEQVNNLLPKHFIIHMQGCYEDQGLSMRATIGVDFISPGCNLTRDNYRSLINEARQCLTA